MGVIDSLLRLPLDRPLLLVPLFVLEELGLPLPLVLGGLFVYVGYAVSQGRVDALAVVGSNIAGCLLGATGIYWASRAGLASPLQRLLARRQLSSLVPEQLSGRKPLMVFWARFIPVPMVLVTTACGLLRVSYFGFAMAVVAATLVWNVPYVVGGIVMGAAAKQIPAELPAIVRYAPLIVVWLAMAALVPFSLRRWIRAKSGDDV